MNTDPLAGLLKAADAAAPSPPAVDGGLADRVRGLRVRRVRRRAAVAAGGAMVLALVVFAVPWLRSGAPEVTQPGVSDTTMASIQQPNADAERLQAEIEALRFQADVSTRLVERLRAERRRKATHAKLHQAGSRGLTSPQLKAAVAAEEAAFIILGQATTLREQHGLDEAADEAYRRVVQLFPNTKAAEIARERLGLSRETQGDRL